MPTPLEKYLQFLESNPEKVKYRKFWVQDKGLVYDVWEVLIDGEWIRISPEKEIRFFMKINLELLN